jgi:hypothetical protein
VARIRSRRPLKAHARPIAAKLRNLEAAGH